MIPGAIQLTTQALLAWVIVAIGVLGFIVANTIQKWYRAIVPALLALALVAFGVYCVVKVSREATPAQEQEMDALGELREPEIAGRPEPSRPNPAPDAPEHISARVADVPQNPYYLSEQKRLKVTVRVTNMGGRRISSVTLSCFVPLKNNPRKGQMSGPHSFPLDKPLEPGTETDLVVTVENIAALTDYGEPRLRVDAAH